MTLSCFPQNSCYLWGLGAMNTQNWKFFLAQNWCNVAQNWPFCFFKKIYPIPFSCFWHEVGKPGLLENPVYLLVFVWSSQLPSQIWLEKRLISDFLHDVRELFKTIWNYDYSNVLNIFFVESFCPKSGQIRPEDDLLDPCKSWRNRKS